MSTVVDQRTDQRRRVMKGTKIAYSDFVFVVDCAVRDLSQSGARISVSSAVQIPDEFMLVFVQDRAMRKARVRWRRASELGVEFEGGTIDFSRDPDPRLRQFKN